MLTIKCAACRRKLWKYHKIGQGEVLRCHRDRIRKVFQMTEEDGKVFCECGKPIGIDKGSFIKMNKNAFTYKGEKVNKR